MRASRYPTLEHQPEKRQVWTVALPDGQSCRFAKLWGPRAPEVWYYYGGARPLGPHEGPELVRACGYLDRLVTRVENCGEGTARLETVPYPVGPGGPAVEAEKVGVAKHLAIIPPTALGTSAPACPPDPPDSV